ncbi:hypothetical protein J6590_015893 [Homalodisca vitripennis]|nr:hypothetical protein J6590_015893 [Homalodisca vitripennis]
MASPGVRCEIVFERTSNIERSNNNRQANKRTKRTVLVLTVYSSRLQIRWAYLERYRLEEVLIAPEQNMEPDNRRMRYRAITADHSRALGRVVKCVEGLAFEWSDGPGQV